MGWKSSLAIHLGFWLYLVGGGLIYYYIENPMYHLPTVEKPLTINATFCQDLMNLVEYSVTLSAGDVKAEDNCFEKWFEVVRETCNNLTIKLENATDINGTGDDPPWEFSSALFLCMTILTTIGYGAYSPKSNWGKVFCIFYGFVGIPICGVVLASTSDYFSNMFLYLYEHRQKKKKNDNKRRSIFIAAVIFLIPGLAVFIFFPAALFVVIEGWSYLDATYFCFITLTTVGFGDIIAAQQTNSKLLWLYRISWIIWVTLGIAYWAIVINFITKALKSKKLREKWTKTSNALSAHAQEIRRVVIRQLSSNTLTRTLSSSTLKSVGQTDSLFIALKTKTAFNLHALHFTDSMGKSLTAPQRKRPPLADIVSAFETAPASETGLELKQRQSVADPPYTSDSTKRKQLSFATDVAEALKSFPGCESDQQLDHHQFMDQHSPVLAERKSLSLDDIAKAYRSASGYGLDQHQHELVVNPSTPVLGGRRSRSLINLIPSQSEMNPTTPSLPKPKVFSPAYFATAFESAPGLDPQQQSDRDQPPAEHEVQTSTENDGSYWPSSFNAPPTIRVKDSSNRNDDNVSMPSSVYLSLNPSRKTSETNNDCLFPRRWFDNEESIRSMYFSLNPSRKTSETSNDYPFPYTAMPSNLAENPPLRDLLIEALLILNEAETNGTILDQN